MSGVRNFTLPMAHGTSVEPGTDWRESAACAQVDPAVFEPDDDHTPSEEEWDQPRAICLGCAVIDECLRDAMAPATRADFGMRGAMTPEERRRRGRRISRLGIGVAS